MSSDQRVAKSARTSSGGIRVTVGVDDKGDNSVIAEERNGDGDPSESADGEYEIRQLTESDLNIPVYVDDAGLSAEVNRARAAAKERAYLVEAALSYLTDREHLKSELRKLEELNEDLWKQIDAETERKRELLAIINK